MADGSGLRTTIYFKGCPLRCVWCSTPQAHERPTRILWDSKHCLYCNLCVSECPTGSLAFSDNRLTFTPDTCTFCRACTDHCPSRMLHFVGQMMNMDEIMEKILADRELYGNGGVILSGGDPLMAKDHELDWLLTQLEAIPHIKRLRIHSRLPIVIPARITDALVERFSHSTLQILLVNHINHANEVDETFRQAMAKLRRVGVTLLNQSVLLRGVNDNAQTLANLSNALFDAGVMPYYLHVLDKVQGAAHFMVSDDEARQIMRELLTLVSGYLVPKLAREIGGEPSKTPLDLQLRQQ